MPNLRVSFWIGSSLLFIGFLYAGYFLERTETATVLTTFTFLFAGYFLIWSTADEHSTDAWVRVGIILRLTFLVSIPSLSDDVFRYLWDGRLLANGIHPFSNVPEYFIRQNILPSVLDQELFNLVASKIRFTIYPSVAQGIFWLAYQIAGTDIVGGIIVIRIFILGAEIGSLYLMKKLLHIFQLPSKNILLYALNPLVILELSGNLHLEALMIFFLLLSVYLLNKNQLTGSAVAFAFAVCVKLIPLIFLPAVLLSLKSIRKAFVYGTVVLVTSVVSFIPLFDWDIVTGFNESFGYYFRRFEFNASIYYLVREWGFWKYGYNIVQTVGWKLGVISGISILLYTGLRYLNRGQLPATNYQSLHTDWMWIYGIYVLFVTILHPWYVLPLLAFSIFTRYRFTIVWSFLIFFTYSGYTQNGYHENLWIVGIEYLLVFGYLGYELWNYFIRTNKPAIHFEK